MSLEFQNIEVLLNKGMDRKTKEELIMMGELKTLKNGVISKLKTDKGMSSAISKRYGYSPYSRTYYDTSYAAQTLSEATGIITIDSKELLLFDKLKMYSLSKTKGEWIEKDIASSLTIDTKDIIRNDVDQAMFDIDADDNYEIYSYIDDRLSGGNPTIRVSIYDKNSENYLFHDYVLATGMASNKDTKCIILNGKFFVFYVNGSGNLVVRRLVIASGLTWEAETTVLATTGLRFDVDKISSTKAAFITSSAAHIVVGQIDESKNLGGAGGLPANYTGVDTAPNYTIRDMCMTIRFDSTNNYLWVGYNAYQFATMEYVRAFVLDLTNSVIVTASTIDSNAAETIGFRIAIDMYSATQAKYIYCYATTQAGTKDGISTNYYMPIIRRNTLTTGGVLGSAAVLMYNMWLQSKTIKINNKIHFLGQVSFSYYSTAPYSDIYSSMFLCDDDANIRAMFAKFKAGECAEANDVSMPKIVISSSKYKSLFRSISGIWGDNAAFGREIFNVKSGMSLASIDYASDYIFNNIYANNVLEIGGGHFLIYNKDKLIENHFHQKPLIINVSSGTTGGTHMSDGVYSVLLAYEYKDNNGNRYISEISDVSTITLSGGGTNQRIIITTPSISATQKESNKFCIAVYRTLNGGSIFYRDTDIDSPYNNDKTTALVTVYADHAEADVQNNEYVYTTGNILENQSIPAPKIVTSYKDRLIALCENELWYSKKITKFLGISFNENLKIPNIKDSGGEISQVIEMDGKLFIFKKDCIYLTTGEGANDLGEGDSFITPEIFASDIGCSEPRSMVLFTNGIIFKSTKGIWLLDRSMNLSYIGKKVESFNGEKIISSVIMKDINHIRFLTSSNNVLVYDYDDVFNQWSYFTNHVGVMATLYDNKFCHVKSDGYVFYENSSVYQDNGTNIELEIETGWLKFSGLLNYARCRELQLLGEYYSDHDLKIRAYYDYNAARYNDYTLDCATALLAGDMVYQPVVKPKYQKCESIKLNIKDANSTGEAFALLSLLARVGMKKGAYKGADIKIAT